MVRVCTKCGEPKALSEFHRHRQQGYQAWCKPCRKAYAADHYQRHRARRKAHNRKRRAEFSAWYAGLKRGKPCADCGGVFPPEAMHWDHLDGATKTADVSRFASAKSRLLLLAEIEKCELVCANCHAVRTTRRRREAEQPQRAFTQSESPPPA
jgi:hypothetical protein